MNDLTAQALEAWQTDVRAISTSHAVIDFNHLAPLETLERAEGEVFGETEHR
jgi:hypothetical protein